MCVSALTALKQVATSVSYLGPSVQATEKHACDIEVVNDVITTLTEVNEMSKCV